MCVLYTCNKFFKKLPECNHSASHHGYATGATQGPGTEQLSVSSMAIKFQSHPHRLRRWPPTHSQFYLSTPPTWPTSKLYSSHPETTHSKILFPGRWPLCWPTHGDD